jgi:ubiquinone/menaquinone biosynthesis C-methylase UbiE
MDVFDRFAERYDRWYEKNRDIYERELKVIPRISGLTVEVGVGTGRFAKPLKLDVGLDISLQMLRIAKRRGVEVVRGDAIALPFKNGIFDAVYLIFTFCFLRDPERSLSEVYRILKNNGKLVLCVIPENSGLARYYMLKDSPFYRTAIFYPVSEIKKMLQNSGFKIVSFNQLNLGFSEHDFVCYVAAKVTSVKAGKKQK